MFGLPVIAIVIVVLAIGGFYIYRRRQSQYRGFFGVGPKSGSEESRDGIVRQVLRRMVWYRGKLEAQLEFDNQWASQAIDTEAALQIHHDADQTRKQLLQQNTDIGNAVAAAGRFGHSNVVKELDLQRHLPSQGH